MRTRISEQVRTRKVNSMIRRMLQFIERQGDEDLIRHALIETFNAGWYAAERSRERNALRRLKR